jgi:hypothetical protein
MDDSLLANHPRTLVRHKMGDGMPLFAGRSLMSLCRGEEVSDWRTFAFSESFGCLCEGPDCDAIMQHPWKKTLRTKDFRYSVSPGRDEGEELFDLRSDPDELVNLVDAPDYQDIRQELKNEMLHRVMLQEFPLPPRDLVVIGAH